MPDASVERIEALRLAVEYHKTASGWDCKHHNQSRCEIRDTANYYFGWLTSAVRIVLTTGPTVDQTSGQITGDPGGNIMKDTEKVQLTVTAEDAKGQVTAAPGDVTFTSADETVATIVTADDGTVWAIAGNPGSTVITGDWPDSPSGDLQGTYAVDVTAGDAVSLTITAGTPVAQ